MLRDGALKTCKYAMELDEKYSISSQTRSIDEQYKISETTSRVASKTKEVIDAVKKNETQQVSYLWLRVGSLEP